MSQTATSSEIIKLPNLINKMAAYYFIVIRHYPDEKFNRFEAFEKSYVIDTGDQQINARLHDLYSVKFKAINGVYTLLSAGMEEHEWKKVFKEKFLNTDDDTRMGIFVYRRY